MIRSKFMNNIELSVIIPVYNTEKYIERCLESVVSAVKKSKVKSEIIIQSLLGLRYALATIYQRRRNDLATTHLFCPLHVRPQMTGFLLQWSSAVLPWG